MDKIKILQITESFDYGGRESTVLQICNNLSKEIFDVNLLVLSCRNSLTREVSHDVSVYSSGIYNKDLYGVRLLLFFLKNIKAIGKFFKIIKPDIIHLHCFYSTFFLLSIAIKLFSPESKVIRTIHTGGMYYCSNTIIDKFKLNIEKISNYINSTYTVAISQMVYENCVRAFSNNSPKIFKIYNGINLSKYSAVTTKLKDNIDVIYVARFDDGKNHSFLVNVWKRLNELNYKHIRLFLVGDGKNFIDISNKIKDNKLNDTIFTLGYRTDIPELLSKADFAVFPSDFEGFSISLLEYMASRLPIITSDIPPFREIIDSGVEGFIISKYDVTEWVNHILILANNSPLRLAMGDNAFETVKKFSIENMAKEYSSVYSEIVS